MAGIVTGVGPVVASPVTMAVGSLSTSDCEADPTSVTTVSPGVAVVNFGATSVRVAAAVTSSPVGTALSPSGSPAVSLASGYVSRYTHCCSTFDRERWVKCSALDIEGDGLVPVGVVLL